MRKHLKITGLSIVVATAVCAPGAHATYIVDSLNLGFQMPGTTIEIQLVPAKPVPGEPFEVLITGLATQICPPLNYGGPQGPGGDGPITGIGVQADMRPVPGGAYDVEYCDPEGFPYEINESFTVEADLSRRLSVDETLRVGFYVDVGRVTLPGSLPTIVRLTAFWEREIDLRRGTHTIPPRLGAGFWISEERPNEGLLIQQQGDTVLAYRLSYGEELTSKLNHVGVWQYASLELNGNTGNGISLKVARPDLEQSDVVFEETLSSSLIVDDYNNVRITLDAGPSEDIADLVEHVPFYRWNFRQSTHEPIVTLPDFSGAWSMIRFSGTDEQDRWTFELGSPRRINDSEWRFESSDRGYQLDCQVSPRGVGACELRNNIRNEALEFDLANFNGNLATELSRVDSGDTGSDALLLRSQYELP
jgi:hypothetical protein